MITSVFSSRDCGKRSEDKERSEMLSRWGGRRSRPKASQIRRYRGCLSGLVVKIHLQCRRCKRHRFEPWVRKIPWRRNWYSIPVFLPGKCHGQRTLWGYSPRDLIESDATGYTHATVKVEGREISPLSSGGAHLGSTN